MKTVAFIISYENELYLNECIFYINALEVPEDCQIDIITISDADSICGAYNAAMDSSDAEYKVYLRPNTLILNWHFIYDFIEVFASDPKIGLLGIAGFDSVPNSVYFRGAYDHGALYYQDNLLYHSAPDMAETIGSRSVCFRQKDADMLRYVSFLDGSILISRTDIRWRNDLILGTELYDLSASIEYQRNGYRLAVVPQEKPWCFVDFKVHTPKDAAVFFCDDFRSEYPECISPKLLSSDQMRHEKAMTDASISAHLLSLIRHDLSNLAIADAAEKKDVLIRLRGYRYYPFTATAYMDILRILLLRKNDISVDELKNIDALADRWTLIRFLLRRIEFQKTGDDTDELFACVRKHLISMDAIRLLSETYLLHPQEICALFEESNHE